MHLSLTIILHSSLVTFIGAALCAPPAGASPASAALERRVENARFTYYNVGLGACGKTNQPSDFIVALDFRLWAGGAECFKGIELSYAGKTVSATVTDECFTCSENGLDLSTGLMEALVGPNYAAIGQVTGSWELNG